MNQLTYLYDTFCQALDSGKEICAAFCDVSKAFDRVWHDGLILLRARRNEEEFRVKPATSFNYFQYLLTENLKQCSRQRKYYLTVP